MSQIDRQNCVMQTHLSVHQSEYDDVAAGKPAVSDSEKFSA
jgi:hypothetical protein